MSPEHIERNPNQIKATIKESLGKLSEQSFSVQEAITQALRDGSVDLQALIAALELSGQLNLTMESFLKNQGEVVFAEGQFTQPTAVVDSEEDKTEPSLAECPKTFGELLRAKIDSELLPTGRDVFPKSEIFEAARNRELTRKAAVAEGFKPHKHNFTREETIQIIYRVFTTPSGAFKKRQEFFSLQDIKASFFPTHRDLLNQLNSAINYDWSQNPTVDYQTAMEIRGLVQLQRIVTGEKVARKGREGEQFTKKPHSSSTQHTDSPLTPSEVS